MDSTMSGGVRAGGEAMSIVQVLREYGKNRAVPAGLVARSVGRDTEEIRFVLDELASNHVVRLDPTNDSVSLIR